MLTKNFIWVFFTKKEGGVETPPWLILKHTNEKIITLLLDKRNL